jgi:hypothetical protein
MASAQQLLAPDATQDTTSEQWPPVVDPAQDTISAGKAPDVAPPHVQVSSPACCNCGCTDCQCPEPAATAIPIPRINLANPAWQLMVGGTMELDMFFNTERPVAPGEPFFLSPDSPFGFDTDTFDAHARQSNIYAALIGPEIGDLKSGGFFLANFFNDSVI